jgi:hypothetical protein
MNSRLIVRWPIAFVALVLAAAVGACAEDVETGAACPMLCPGQEIVIKDTIIEPAYVFDTTLIGFPSQGIDGALLLAARGDTLDTRVVIRFDTLIRRFLPTDGDTAEQITHIDSAFVTLRVRLGRVPMPFRATIEAFDVSDSTLNDTARLALLPYFVPERSLGIVQLDSVTFTDSVRLKIPIDSAKMREIIEHPSRPLRIGLQVSSTSSVEFVITPENLGSDGPLLQYRFHADTAYDPIIGIEPSSMTPATPVFIAQDYVDYSIIVDAPDITRPGTFALGGLPGARAYLRFDLPTWLTDSVGVLRARLELTQDPVYGPSDADTVRMLTHLVLAGHSVTDLHRAATLLTSGGLAAPTILRVPRDSGIVYLDMNTLVRQWQSFGLAEPLPRAIVLRSDTEGSSTLALRFFGAANADPALRPKLRISYTPSILFGRP